MNGVMNTSLILPALVGVVSAVLNAPMEPATKHLCGYASYTEAVKSSRASASTNVLSGLWQVISIGISFNPVPVHFRGVL
jgi:hypothetical protein